ncbi:hypothetical protein ACFQ1E_08710 [Sphingomonas canadensis]|uniref:Glycine zipper family protein n=1 Tax=Sphingomonas canadensis TaxID=1219257 RepID=A0ABW3H4L8_9SPHN|nr:hypothetical protein [Sphingomonas canadensis]MCW3836120.1 hypothetical protein [Sphingomonas canadensis]
MSSSNTPNPVAGGSLLALFLIAGAIVGMIYGQPTIGLLGGAGGGIAVATLLWLKDRKRG